MEYAIETVALTKVFSDWWGRAKVYAVDDLNLQIRPNEVFGLLGPNGSGKTTTIKMLLGLLHPTKGHAVMLGGDATNPKINARIGFLPEESYLYRFLNARETLDFYGRLFKLDSKTRELRIEALLDMVGLKAVASRPVGTYSKGMARRIGLAQALINDPDLLILDEPTTGLDPIGTRQIKDLIVKLAERGKTVLLCSHLLADVEDVCDRIAILYGGKVQAHGRVRDLLQKTNKRQIVTDAISDATADRIRELLKKEHADCEISSPMERLETFFINTVVQAQQQATPTSGAVSTTQIGDFLAARSVKETVLDKLVGASVAEKPDSGPAKTEKSQPRETVVPQPNKDLLSKLTQSASTVKPTAASPVQTNRVENVPETTVKPSKTKKSIIDELTGEKQPDGSTSKPTGNPQEDGGHA
ncbi:MAG: ABC transporter ATP-binding protein [Planctomycetes bacterium]|nr:ABC transporter ATP-binding protein [Planctomycetota bacterium]